MNFRVFLFRVLVWRIVSQGDRFVPEDVNLFCFFFKPWVFSIYVPLRFGLLLKPSGFLCTDFLKMQCFFCYFFKPSVFSIYVLLHFGFVPHVCC
ncbi:hypothetical protein LXL04_032665 [Taraxacum kok-saghyz]